MKKTLFTLFVLLQFVASAQLKELSLEDAVMQQYRGFYPDQLSMFQWVPETDCYTYLDNYQKLMKASVGKPEAKEWFNIQTVNEKLGAELYWFSGFKWKNANEFWLDNGKQFYSFNTVEEKGKLLHDIGDGENAKMHSGSENLAYTVDNNVYIHTADGRKIVVTDNSDKNIVSGKAIARSEFGITQGLFWSNDGLKLAFYQKDESEVADYPLLDITTPTGSLMNIKYPMAGQKSEKPKVGIYNVKTGKTVFRRTHHPR